jgi:cysteine desulfuration protein SufE
VEEFSIFTDWTDKYGYLIDLGKEVPEMEMKFKNKQNLISGCQSQVWLYTEFKDGRIYFHTDSDAILTKGLAWLLVKVYNGHTPDEILETEPWFIEKIDLAQHLSPTRSNGLLAMVKKIKIYAMAYKAKSST